MGFYGNCEEIWQLLAPVRQTTLITQGLLQCETHLHNLQDPIHLKKVV